jgi:hypothetical protein
MRTVRRPFGASLAIAAFGQVLSARCSGVTMRPDDAPRYVAADVSNRERSWRGAAYLIGRQRKGCRRWAGHVFSPNAPGFPRRRLARSSCANLGLSQGADAARQAAHAPKVLRRCSMSSAFESGAGLCAVSSSGDPSPVCPFKDTRQTHDHADRTYSPVFRLGAVFGSRRSASGSSGAARTVRPHLQPNPSHFNHNDKGARQSTAASRLRPSGRFRWIGPPARKG